MYWHLHWHCPMPMWDSRTKNDSECKYRCIKNTPFYITSNFEEDFNSFVILCMILFTKKYFFEISKMLQISDYIHLIPGYIGTLYKGLKDVISKNTQ